MKLPPNSTDRKKTKSLQLNPAPDSKRLKGSGFCTAGSLLSSSGPIISNVDGRDPSVHEAPHCAAITSFQTARTLLLTASDVDHDHVDNNELSSEISRRPNDYVTKGKGAVVSLRFSIKGVNHYVSWEKILDRLVLSNEDAADVVLLREPNNEHDTNAIACFLPPEVNSNEENDSNHGEGDQKNGTKIGYVSKKHAAFLAPLLDQILLLQIAGTLRVCRCSRKSLQVEASFFSRMMTSIPTELDGMIRVHDMLEKCNFAESDLWQSYSAPFRLPLPERLIPWNPKTTTTTSKTSLKSRRENPTEQQQRLELEHGWPIKDSSTTITEDERKSALEASWPPSDKILAKLGLGGVDDEDWWEKTAGLFPPSQWNVTGAYDLVGTKGRTSTPPVALESLSQVKHTTNVLDGAIHGVSNVWTPEALQEIRDLIHQANFWLRRKGESFIRVFGGPYVLGQKKDDLRLICGSPHSELSSKICRAHNLIYTAIHLTLPDFPGYNSAIFSLSLSGSGFHYHQDAIGELYGKNVPLLPKQSVVTTVFYEKPEQDSGKETVFWKPMLNFRPRAAAATAATAARRQVEAKDQQLYLAARALPTVHGLVHVQRAGLQKVAQHGIFHTPTEEGEQGHGPRVGYRVAITARITHPDATDRLRPFLEQYKGVDGPYGNMTLPVNARRK